jgi:hypothetical protein
MLIGDDVAVRRDDESTASDGHFAAFPAGEDFFDRADVNERGGNLILGRDDAIVGSA